MAGHHSSQVLRSSSRKTYKFEGRLFCITYETTMRFLTKLFRCQNSKARILQSANMFVLFTIKFKINSLKLIAKYSVKKKKFYKTNSPVKQIL